jgi:transcriptional regulator with XRE-family HTH domain
MPYISEKGKVTLLDIKRKHGLSIDAIAAAAGVEPGLVYWMEQGGVLSKQDLEKILEGLSRVTGQNYSMQTVGGYWVKKEKQV